MWWFMDGVSELDTVLKKQHMMNISCAVNFDQKIQTLEQRIKPVKPSPIQTTDAWLTIKRSGQYYY